MIRTPAGVVRTGLLVYTPLALIALAFLVARSGLAGAVDHVVGDHVTRDAALGVGVGLMLVGLTRVATHFLETARRAESALAEAVGPLTTGECVLLALVSGVAEEMLFRGVIQPWIGLAATSVIFGLAHVPIRRELLAWPLFAALVGGLFGWMTLTTGALLAPILAHVVVNALNLRALSRTD